MQEGPVLCTLHRGQEGAKVNEREGLTLLIRPTGLRGDLWEARRPEEGKEPDGAKVSVRFPANP